MTEQIDQRAVMGSAIVNAFIDVSRAEDRTSLVDPVAARQAMIVAMAMLMEANPAIQTPKDMREAAEEVARDLRLQLRVLRDHRAATGERAWDARPVQLN